MVASSWVQASRGEWYVVLKLFSGFEDCLDHQPESWHQYGVGKKDGVGLVHNLVIHLSSPLSFGKPIRTDTAALEKVNRT